LASNAATLAFRLSLALGKAAASRSIARVISPSTSGKV
jgi:hypothetical protein